MNARENLFEMLRGGQPRRLPFDLPTTAPVEQLILERTGKNARQAFDPDFEPVYASFPDDDPERWKAAYEAMGISVPENAVIMRMGITFLKPPVSTLGRAVHLLEMLHPLADIERVEELEALPWPDVSTPIDPARYQDRIAFCGMIGTQTTMPFGTPNDVRAAVERCRRLHHNGARLIVAPTHVLEPDVPWENITAFVEAAREAF